MELQQHQNTKADRSLGDRSGGLRPYCSPRIPTKPLGIPTRGLIPTKTLGIPTGAPNPTTDSKQSKIIAWWLNNIHPKQHRSRCFDVVELPLYYFSLVSLFS
jgi:hypothetical protein